MARTNELTRLAEHALSLARDGELSASDRLAALMRYDNEERAFIASQPVRKRPLIQGPAFLVVVKPYSRKGPPAALRSDFAELKAQLQRAVKLELEDLDRARPDLVRARMRLLDRIAPGRDAAIVVRGVERLQRLVETLAPAPGDTLQTILQRTDQRAQREFEDLMFK